MFKRMLVFALLGAWSLSQLSCFTPQVVALAEKNGRSLEGRVIPLYQYGDSDKPIILIQGGIHGNEWQAVRFMYDLIDFLDEIKFDPQNYQLWMLPVVNPDGYVNAQRFNSREVDLNRNFGTGNWQSKTMPSNDCC